MRPIDPVTDTLAYGGDYNPEQWSEEVWREDVKLMREAGVNLVSLGIFSWVRLEPREGEYDFGWLDLIMDLLHEGGIRVDLATPTAAPPAWFSRAHPESLPMTREGYRQGTGSRQSFCPSSPAYRAAAARITEAIARRYADHPALAMWHSHNEFGNHNAACWCPESAADFRRWLRARYGTLDALNDAWGTAFWGQRYGDWEEIDVPRITPTAVNPCQQLDFMRFSSDAHLANYTAERDILRRYTPGVPVTTNFMANTCKNIDYWRWAPEVDVVSNDHYLIAERPDNQIELALAADLTRSLAGGAPWILMEHSTGAVNWQPRNIAKRPGEMHRNSLAHVARGADGVLFFQWRAARAGAEKFHSAMLPHGGTDTRTWREVVALGDRVRTLTEVRGSRVVADAAVVWDWNSWWALELDWRPSVELRYIERIEAYYEQLWRDHRTVDFVRPDTDPADLARYPMVVVPSLYLLREDAAAGLRAYVEGGGHLVVSYFSGIVDEHDAVHSGRYPGALREVLGLSVEQWAPLREGERVGLALADGADGVPSLARFGDGGPAASADVWTEELRLEGAEAVLRYTSGPAAGLPAVTRHRLGAGTAWYVSTRLDGAGLAAVLAAAGADAGLPAAPELPAGVELVRRRSEDAEYLFAINHTAEDATVPGSGTELFTGAECAGVLPVPAGEVRVLRTAPSSAE
ncbi:beta-galactosidase [Allostreptomyces psammosilenae]|uniref:Beta-galactosidase n=1 Tax=Allostreptomyces psammosilenae TaxID=1892865 RepID=A0A852ZYL5_9ACTN|nr:beta-galactosidase [Allostreptomyces psammosilenae]NYI06907.1 beta-galactosidase [Allostreptomyces psammosilenae]